MKHIRSCNKYIKFNFLLKYNLDTLCTVVSSIETTRLKDKNEYEYKSLRLGRTLGLKNKNFLSACAQN